MRLEQPKALPLRNIVDEREDIRSFYFDSSVAVRPGQFVLLWLPGDSQKPFCVSSVDKSCISVTVQKRGPFTEKLFTMKKGDYIGVQGPYGRPFSPKGKNPVLVAQGYGAAPLSFLADCLKDKTESLRFIYCAETEEDIFFKDRHEMLLCKGGVEQITDTVMMGSVDALYVYAAEKITKELLSLSLRSSFICQIFLERYIRCGFGLCGQCTVDPGGLRVCVEGPVFDRDVAYSIQEIGEYMRDETGKKRF